MMPSSNRSGRSRARRRNRKCCAGAMPRRSRKWWLSWPKPFRETLVLREIHNLSYREIANIVAAPVGTVMSRLARARALLRTAWMADEEQSK